MALIALGVIWGSLSAPAQDAPSPAPTSPAPVAPVAAPATNTTKTVVDWEGAGPLTTPTFEVLKQWEIKWTARVPFKITVYGKDHALIAGETGVRSGSFFMAAPGTYYLQIDAAAPPPEAPVSTQASPPTAEGSTTGLSDGTPTPAPAHRPTLSSYYHWTVNITETGDAIAPAAAPAPVATGPAPGTLNDDQLQAIVQISGDNLTGSGFLVKTSEGPAVVTNVHTVANNPHLKITTHTGADIPMLSARAASDRDLVLLAIQDAGYSYLPPATEISRTVKAGDDLVLPGSDPQGLPVTTLAKVQGIGPERIIFDAGSYRGSGGGPVFHSASGKVLGIVTQDFPVTTAEDLAGAPFARREAKAAATKNYFGLRLDTVFDWIPLDWDRLQVETNFLDQFHKKSRDLDSFLNGKDVSSDNMMDNGSKLYREDDAIVKANDRYYDDAAGGDASQKTESARGLLFDLQGVADTSVDQIKVMTNFYPFDQERAGAERDYRKALSDQLGRIGDSPELLHDLPRAR